MRIRLIRLWALPVALAAMLAWPQPALACTCVPPSTPGTAFAQSDAVFVGRVMGVADPGGMPLLETMARLWPGVPASTFSDRYVVLRVASAWKGVHATEVVVRTTRSPLVCGNSFNPSGQYLIYARRAPGGLRTDSCTRTAELAFANADLTYLQAVPNLRLGQTSYVTFGFGLCFASVGLGLLLAATWTRARFRGRASSYL